MTPEEIREKALEHIYSVESYISWNTDIEVKYRLKAQLAIAYAQLYAGDAASQAIP